MTDHNPINNTSYLMYKGFAAQDLPSESSVLAVICPELMPNSAYGEVAPGITQESIALKTRDGKTITTNVTTANHIVATWEGQSNHRLPPLVRKGEPVEIYRAEGQDKYLWRVTGRGREFRKTDRIHMEIGATDPKNPSTEKNDTNTYSMYMDSERQIVGMKTSKANGEVAAFSMEANLATGVFHLSDDSPGTANRIVLDTGGSSGVPCFQVDLTSGTTLKMEGDHVYLKVKGKFLIDVGDRLVVNSPLSVVNIANKGSIIVNATNVAINAAKDIILSAGSVIGLNSRSISAGGVLAAAKAKIVTLVKPGNVSTDTKPVSVSRPVESNAIDGGNSADTDMAGIPYRN